MIRRHKTTIFTDAKESTTVYELKRIVEGILKRPPEDQRLYKVSLSKKTSVMSHKWRQNSSIWMDYTDVYLHWTMVRCYLCPWSFKCLRLFFFSPLGDQILTVTVSVLQDDQLLEDSKTLGDCGFTNQTARPQAPATVGLAFRVNGRVYVVYVLSLQLDVFIFPPRVFMCLSINSSCFGNDSVSLIFAIFVWLYAIGNFCDGWKCSWLCGQLIFICHFMCHFKPQHQ